MVICAVKAILPSAPPLRGKEMDLCMFINTNHAGDKWTMRSRTAFMIHMNTSLIDWYSKK